MNLICLGRNMSKIRKILESIADKNKISLYEDNNFNMSDEEYVNELSKWREEEEEERNSLYNYTKPWKTYKPVQKSNDTSNEKSVITPKKAVDPNKLQFYKFKSSMNKLIKNLRASEDYSDINEWAQELDRLRKRIKTLSAFNPYLKSLIDENTLAEGDKKIFDKNSGYNVSEDELYIFDKLKEKYPNIQMSVTDDRMISPDTHRHWELDFYDPDSDTGFNYNKHIRHGRRKYNSEDPNCQADVKWLQRQEGDFYKKILHTWRDLDPLKREVAKVNGLKYIEWFNLDEFNKWFENPELSYEEYRYAPDSLQYDSEEYFDQKARGRDVYGNDSQPYAP